MICVKMYNDITKGTTVVPERVARCLALREVERCRSRPKRLFLCVCLVSLLILNVRCHSFAQSFTANLAFRFVLEEVCRGHKLLSPRWTVLKVPRRCERSEFQNRQHRKDEDRSCGAQGRRREGRCALLEIA